MNNKLRLLVVLSGMLCLTAPAYSAPSLAILPASVQLTGPEARQQLLAEASLDGRQQDWTHRVEWSSSDHRIATVSETGLVRPVRDGSAVITARAEGIGTAITVTVQGTAKPFSWSFRNQVIPVLTKMGCNQGACHGALAGKNGFKLTLRGYDPQADHRALTRESVARRVTLADPASSLMLLKSTAAVPHGGGKRFDSDSLEYRVIAEWIAAGAPAPTRNAPDVIGLDVYPRAVTLEPGATQRVVVNARYSDGSVSDVSRWAKYATTDEAIASVDDAGMATMTGHGQVAITVWYSSKVRDSRLTVPFPNEISEDDFRSFPRNNFVDDFVLAKLKKLRIAPSRPATDSEFIRRAFLDATGTLPSAEEVEQFLDDTSPDKRTRLIDSLLERDEFVDYWAYKWSDLLLVSSENLEKTAMWDFYNWIRDAVKTNKPWDDFTREILTSSGSTRRHPALNYFVIHQETAALAENVTQAFMGQRLMCARCHNHPLEKWTQTQYYRFANLFARIAIKDGRELGDSIVFTKSSGDIPHPRLLRPLPPTPLDGEPLPLDSPEDRRLHLARWLTSSENPYFARNLVSRVWANFFARGLVFPEDDLRATNPASNEELFSALVKDFVDHDFDVKHLIRTIMNSGTYQLASEPNATNETDNKYYSKYIVKRLSAEVILDAYSRITGVPSEFEGYPRGMRALELPDVEVNSQFLDSFGRPDRLVCDVKERSSDPSVAQALHVINGDTLNNKLRNQGSNINLFLKLGLSDSRILEHVFLSAFSRYPTESERESILAALRESRQEQGPVEARRQARREALQDMLWALLTKKEFLFNH